MATKRSGAARRRNRAERREVASILGDVRSCIGKPADMASHDIPQKHVNLVQPAHAKGSWHTDADGVIRPEYLREGHLRTTYGYEPLVAHASGGKDLQKSGVSAYVRAMHHKYVRECTFPKGTGSGTFDPREPKHNGVMVARKEIGLL